MNIIEVIPISRTVGMDILSYFTSKDVSVGTIIDIPLRKKIIQGIIISSKKALEMKSEIKNASFALKKIEKIKSTEFFSESFMNTAREIADYYATSIGSVIGTIVPDYILKNINKLEISKSEITNKSEDPTEIIKEKYTVQGDDEERYGTWKSLIRQEFAKKKSLLFVLPTIEDAEYAFELLEKGITGYAFLLHGSLPSKTIIDTWNKAVKEKHPIIIVATPTFLSIPRGDIETIVVEKENSRSYKTLRKPFIDFRHVIEIFARNQGIKIFFADSLLRIETLWRHSMGEIIEASPFKFRSLSTAQDILIDMKSYKSETESFRVLSEQVEKLIQQTKNESEQMIILVNRRGLSPTTVCGDCQNIVLCNNCSTPVVLHKIKKRTNIGEEEKNFFMCHKCGEQRSAEEYCKTCGSWKLTTIGIGIDLVVEKIKEKFPEINIFKIDSENTKTGKIARNTIQKFKSKPGSVLIGTEMMFQYLHDKIENSAIISLDSLFSLPDFRIQEKILYILVRMHSLTTRNFLVQTRKPDEKIFEYGLKGNMSNFYKNEIEERKKYNYPPFTTLIKITLEGKKDTIVKEMEEIQNELDPYEVEVFPAFTHTVKGNFVLHGLIREKWPNIDLLSKLRNLPPSVTIKVDPETLL